MYNMIPVMITGVDNGVLNTLHCFGKTYLKDNVNVMTYVIKRNEVVFPNFMCDFGEQFCRAAFNDFMFHNF